MRPKRNQEERQIQMALIKWTQTITDKRIKDILTKYLWHTPNGGSRNVIEAHNLMLMGVKSGVPDLFLAYPNQNYHGYFIELKASRGKVTGKQAIMMEDLQTVGYKVNVFYDWQHAATEITDYLK